MERRLKEVKETISELDLRIFDLGVEVAGENMDGVHEAFNALQNAIETFEDKMMKKSI